MTSFNMERLFNKDGKQVAWVDTEYIRYSGDCARIIGHKFSVESISDANANPTSELVRVLDVSVSRYVFRKLVRGYTEERVYRTLVVDEKGTPDDFFEWSGVLRPKF